MTEDPYARLEMVINNAISQYMDICEEHDIETGIVQDDELFVNANIIADIILQVHNINVSFGDPRMSDGSAILAAALRAAVVCINNRNAEITVEDIL